MFLPRVLAAWMAAIKPLRMGLRRPAEETPQHLKVAKSLWACCFTDSLPSKEGVAKAHPWTFATRNWKSTIFPIPPFSMAYGHRKWRCIPASQRLSPYATPFEGDLITLEDMT